MRGAILLLPHYAFRAWCSVKAHGQLYLYLYLFKMKMENECQLSARKDVKGNGPSLFKILYKWTEENFGTTGPLSRESNSGTPNYEAES
jgi:hypothetical protein